jgi:hypothetical protein
MITTTTTRKPLSLDMGMNCGKYIQIRQVQDVKTKPVADGDSLPA